MLDIGLQNLHVCPKKIEPSLPKPGDLDWILHGAADRTNGPTQVVQPW